MTSGYVPLDYDYGVYHLRLRRHSASSPPLPPCLFTAFPACPPGYGLLLALALSRSLARSPARLSSSSSCSSRGIYIFLIRFSFFLSFDNLLHFLFFLLFCRKIPAKDFFFCFFVLFLVFFILWNCMHFPFLASFASASSWLPFSFSVFSLFLTLVCNCFVPSVVEAG